MHPATTPRLPDRLAALRTELIDLAYDLDVRGACAAAAVAVTTSTRIAGLCAEFSVAPGDAGLRLNSNPRSVCRDAQDGEARPQETARRRASAEPFALP